MSANSVRKRILQEIEARLDGIPQVGVVVDAADRDPDIVATIQGDKAVLDFDPRSDRGLESEGEKSGWGVEAWRFDVIVLIHWSPKSTFATGRPPRETAAEFHSLVTGIYSSKTDPEGHQTFGNLAYKTVGLGGGGYGFSPLGEELLVVESAFEVTYRHTYGNDEEAR